MRKKKQNKEKPDKHSYLPKPTISFYKVRLRSQVAIALNIREPEATQFNLEYWKLSRLDSLYRIYQETNGNISSLVELHKQMNAAGISCRSD